MTEDPTLKDQIARFTTVLGQIHGLGAELVAISRQTPDYALTDVDRKQLAFPVLGDVGNHVARRYGLVFKMARLEPSAILSALRGISA